MISINSILLHIDLLWQPSDSRSLSRESECAVSLPINHKIQSINNFRLEHTLHHTLKYRRMSTVRTNCRFAVPKKGRLYEKVTELLKGAGISFRREARLDVAECTDFPLTLVFLPAADIAKYVGQGNVDLGITGLDVVEESNVQVEKVMDLGFGACKLCVQAPIANQISDVQMLAGKRIVTSFPHLTKQFFDVLDAKNGGGSSTSINFVSGSVEAACGLGLADAVVDLVETGTTMKVRDASNIVSFYLLTK